LSRGENELFVARQLGHKSVEMVRRTYGKWIKDGKTDAGYEFKADWSSYAAVKED
jgi:integrase